MGEEIGPISAKELKDAAESGAISPDTLVRKAGMDDWVTADRVKGLFTPSSKQSTKTVVQVHPQKNSQHDAEGTNTVSVSKDNPSESDSTTSALRSDEIHDSVPINPQRRTLSRLHIVGGGALLTVAVVSIPFVFSDPNLQRDEASIAPSEAAVVETHPVRQEQLRQAMKSLVSGQWDDVESELDLLKTAPLNGSEVSLYELLDITVRLGKVLAICEAVSKSTSQQIASARHTFQNGAEKVRAFKGGDILYNTLKGGIEMYEDTGHFKIDAAQLEKLNAHLSHRRIPDSADDSTGSPFSTKQVDSSLLSKYVRQGQYSNYFHFEQATTELRVIYKLFADVSGKVYHGTAFDPSELETVSVDM